MTNFNGIWQRMKKDAIKWAHSKRPMPNSKECIEHIGRVAEMALPRSGLPTEARDFYASEFYAMIAVERKRRAYDSQSRATRF